MKNFLKKLIIPLILFSSLFSQVAFAAPTAPEIAGEGMILMDATTGQILASKNGESQFAPASTTKVMTALLTLENTKLSDVVTVGKNPPFAEGSSIGLKEGDQYTVEELLHGLLLESANDCAVALAEHVAGSEEAFAKLMNEKAKELGAKNTNFVTVSGLYEDAHLTTPYDLALIMREASLNKDFVRIARTTSYELPASKVDGFTKWSNNQNALLFPYHRNYYENIIAGKTGYTTKSRFTYVAAAEKDGQKLIVALFKYESKDAIFQDAINLFNYGFDNFNLIKLYSEGEEVSTYKINDKTEIPLLASNDIYYVNDLSKFGSKSVNDLKKTISPTFKVEEKDLSRQNFKKGDTILNSELYIGESAYTSLALASGVDFKYTFFNKTINHISDYKILYSIALISLIVLIIFIIFKLKRNSRSNYTSIFRNNNSGFKFRRKRTKQLFGKSKNKYD